MRILIIKTSSLGDVVHTLPALTDAHRHLPGARFDWVVEDAFAEIPWLHPAVTETIPVSLRYWRKRPWEAWRSGAWSDCRARLRRYYYDYVIDAQGLLKSAFLALQARGQRHGFDRHSAREALASLTYHHQVAVPKGQHAVTRLRQLFAAVLGYSVPDGPPRYGINRHNISTLSSGQPTLVFLHGTTWPSKHWPLAHWRELAGTAAAAGYQVRLPWGNQAEHQRAQRIAADVRQVSLIPPSNLQGLAAEISTADAVVGVDTGLVHLAAALDVPSVTLYGSTDPALTGTLGEHQVHLQAHRECAPCLRRECRYPPDSELHPPCYRELSPRQVWQTLLQQIQTSHGQDFSRR